MTFAEGPVSPATPSATPSSRASSSVRNRLCAKHVPHLRRDHVDQLIQRVPPRHPQRQHVRRHAGDRPLGRAPDRPVTGSPSTTSSAPVTRCT